MSETKVEEKQETKVETKSEEVVELSPIEVTATEQGWMPKDAWEAEGKDPAEWRPAKEFVDRGELFKTIHSNKRELKQTQAALSALQRHYSFVFERAHKQAIDDLRKEKRQAIRAEDLEKAEAIDQEIEEKQETFAKEKAELTQQQTTAQVGPPPEFVQWQEVNQWYNADEDMRAFADGTGMSYMAKNPGIPPVEVLKHIDRKMRQQFPNKFGIKKTAPNPTSVSDKTRNRVSKGDDEVVLNDMEREIMKTLVESGTLTEAQYKADLKKVRG